MSEEIAGLIVTVDTRQVEEGVNDLERLANASIGVERNIQRAASGFSSYSSTIRQLSPLLTSTVYSLNSSNSAFQLMGEHASAASARMIAGMSGAASASQIANRAIHDATGSLTAGMSSAASASQRAANIASDTFANMASRNRASMGAMTESMMHSLDSINTTLAQLNANMANTGRVASNTANNIQGISGEMGNAGNAAAAGLNNAQGSIQGLSASAMGLRGLFAGLFSGFAVTESIKGLIGVNSEMQTLRTRLVTVVGDVNSASVAFKNIQTFAAQTPFEIAQVTDAFIQLKNAGLDSSNDALTSYGNTASAMGKQLSQVIAAVADATHGQYERLIDAFGVQAHKMGNQVEFTFKGVSTTVGNNAKEITQYLQSIGDVQFAGGMERQAKTIDGVMSTLKDNFRQYIDDLIPDSGESAIAEFFQGLANNISSIGNSIIIATSSLTAFAVAEGITALATGGLTAALTGLGTVMAFIAGLNLFSLVLATVGAATAGLYLYRDALVSIGDTNASISDYLESTWNIVKSAAIDAVNTILKLFPAIGIDAQTVGAFIIDVFKNAWNIVATLARAAANFVIGAFNGVGQSMGIIAAGIINNFSQAFNKVKAMASGLSAGVKSAMSGDFSFKDLKAESAQKANFSNVAGDVKAALGKAFSTDYVGNFAAQIKSGATQLHSLRTMIDASATSMKDANKHTDSLANATNKLGGAHKGAAGHAGNHANAQSSLNKLLQEAQRLTESLYTPEEKFNAEMAKATELYNKGAISLETYDRALTKTRDELDKTSETLKRQQTMWDEYVKQANELDKIKDDALGAQRIAVRAEELKLQGLSIDAIKEQLSIEKQINDAIDQSPNIDASKVREYTQIRIDAENKVNKIINKNVSEQDTAYKRMLENIQDAGAKMFEDLFNGDGVKSFSSFLDTIKSAFIKVISNDFSRALGTLFSGAKTDWAGIFSGALAVGVSAIANILTSDKKTTSPSTATTTQNTNAYGTGAMAIADTGARRVFLDSISGSAYQYTQAVETLTSAIRANANTIIDFSQKMLGKLVTTVFGDQIGSTINKFTSLVTNTYNDLSAYGSKLVNGVSNYINSSINSLVGVSATATSAGFAGLQGGSVAGNWSAGIASQSGNTFAGSVQASEAAASSTASSASNSAISNIGAYTGPIAIALSLVKLGFDLVEIAAKKNVSTMSQVSQSLNAASNAALGVAGAVAVIPVVGWIGAIIALAVAGALKVGSAATDSFENGFNASNQSSLQGGILGDVVYGAFGNEAGATMLTYAKPNPNSIPLEGSPGYFTSGHERPNGTMLQFGFTTFGPQDTMSASVGTKTPFGYTDFRLDDVGGNNDYRVQNAVEMFKPLLQTIVAFDTVLATSIGVVDKMFGQNSTIAKFDSIQTQKEHETSLKGLESSGFVTQRLDDITQTLGETGTKAGETVAIWWKAFSDKLLKPGNENAQYNATTSFNIEAFIAAELPKLAQLPTKLADLFVASVKSVADGATQQEFESQMNDFFTGWTIAEEGLKQVGININNTYLPEYLTSLTKIGFTVKDGAIALVKYADTFAYAGSTASDKFNEAFNKIFENAKNKNYNTEQTTGFISSYTTFGGIFKDLGISTTNEQLTTFADKLNSTSMMATQAANDLIDHAIADAGMGNKSRDAAIQLLVLQGKLDDTKIAAASFGAALVKEQQRIMEGIDFVAQIVAGTGVKFDSLGLSATDLLGVSDLLIQRFGDMKTAISETSAFIETAFGKPALTQYQSNQAYSQQQSIIDRNPQFAEYGLFAGMNSQQLQAANVAASEALKIDMNQLISYGTKLMVENPDLQTFVNLTKSFDTQENPNGYQYNTNFNNSVTNAVTTSATESTVNTTASDNAKTLSDLQKTINDRLKEIGNTEIQNSIISVTNKIQEMVVSAKAAGGELKNISELQAAELRVIFKPTVEEFNNIGKTDIQKSLDSINTWASEMIAVAPDIAAAYNQSTSDILSGIDKLKDSKAQEIFKDVVEEFSNLGKTDYQKSLEGIEEWAGNMIAVSSDLAAAYNISTQTALDGIATVKQARIDALNAEKEKIIADAKTTYSRLGATDLENELYSLRDSFYGTITDLVKNGGNLEQAALLITIAMDTGYKAFQKAAQAVKDSAASIQKEINAKGFTISDKIVELTNPKGLDEVQRARALADINSTNYQDQLTAVDTLYNLAMAKHDAEMEKYNKEIERINSIKTSIAGIKDFIDSFKVSTESLISPEDRLKESRAQYQTQLALARAGDETAMGKVQGAFSTYIDANKNYYGSTSPTQDAITQGLKDLGELTLKSNDPQVNIENYTRNTVTELQTLQGVLRTISQQQTDKLSSDLKALETQTGKIGQEFMQSMYTLGAQFGVTAAQIDAAIKAIKEGLTVKPVVTPPVTPPTTQVPSVLPDTMNPNSPNFVGPVNPNPLPAVFNPSNPNFVGPIQPGSKPITYAQPSVNTANLSPSSPMYLAQIAANANSVNAITNNTTNTTTAPVKKKSDADIAYFDNLIAKGSYSQAASYAKSYGYSNTEIATYVSALNGSSQSSVMDWLKSHGYEKGGDYPGGLAMVGEKGPELINFNQGGHISTAAQTKELLSKPDKKESSAELERKLEEQNKLITKLIQLTQAAAQETISESRAQTQELKGIHQKTRIKEGVK